MGTCLVWLKIHSEGRQVQRCTDESCVTGKTRGSERPRSAGKKGTLRQNNKRRSGRSVKCSSLRSVPEEWGGDAVVGETPNREWHASPNTALLCSNVCIFFFFASTKHDLLKRITTPFNRRLDCTETNYETHKRIAGCKEDRTGKEQAKRTCFKTCTDKYLWLLGGISTCCKHIYILQLDTMTQMTEAHGHDDPSMTVGDGGSGFVGNRPTRKKRKKTPCCNARSCRMILHEKCQMEQQSFINATSARK